MLRSCWDKPVVDPGFSRDRDKNLLLAVADLRLEVFSMSLIFFESFCKKSYVDVPPHHPGIRPPTTCMQLVPDFLIETVYKTVMMFLMGEL